MLSKCAFNLYLRRHVEGKGGGGKGGTAQGQGPNLEGLPAAIAAAKAFAAK
jgi:alanyl-tRNA synthetase